MPNMVAVEIAERLEPFVRPLRARRPETPILVVEDRTYQDAFLLGSHIRRTRSGRRRCARPYDRLVAAGVTSLQFLAGANQLGDDGEATVDGSHPTDLGFVRQADVFAGAIVPLLRAR